MTQPLRRIKSKRYIWQGLGLLVLGSALLLACKWTASQGLQSTLLFGGAGTLLLGNGYMLYGLLHHADSRSYAGEEETPPAPSPENEDIASASLSPPTAAKRS